MSNTFKSCQWAWDNATPEENTGIVINIETNEILCILEVNPIEEKIELQANNGIHYQVDFEDFERSYEHA